MPVRTYRCNVGECTFGLGYAPRHSVEWCNSKDPSALLDSDLAGSALVSDLTGSSLPLSTAGVSTRADISARAEPSEPVEFDARSERGRATARAINICAAPW